MASPEDKILGGRRIATALQEFGRFVEKREIQLMAEMIARYRSGRTEHDWLIGKVAELSAGQQMLSEMKRELAQETSDG